MELMDGTVVDQKTIERDIGSPEQLRFAKPTAKASKGKRPTEEEAKITKALRRCKKWLREPINGL
jgi:hypothetical protein